MAGSGNYKKQHKNSFTLGVYPTIELLQHKPNSVTKVYLSKRGTRNKGINKIVELCELYKINFEYNDKTIDKISPKENIHAVGVFDKYDSPIRDGKNHVVLVNPQDIGNVGTIIRSMIAFNFLDLVIISPGVDVFHPKAVRSSMGGVFQINFSYFPTLNEYHETHVNHLYLITKNGNTFVEQVQVAKPFSLVLGNEADGLRPEHLSLGESIKIRQSTRVDFLNLSVAAGICMYETSKQL